MVAAAIEHKRSGPFSLITSGEANEYADTVSRIVGPRLIETFTVDTEDEMLGMVRAGLADAIILDEAVSQVSPLSLLQMIRSLDESLLVVLLTSQADPRRLTEAMKLTAFSVVIKPLVLEELLLQIHRMMKRLETRLRKSMP